MSRAVDVALVRAMPRPIRGVSDLGLNDASAARRRAGRRRAGIWTRPPTPAPRSRPLDAQVAEHAAAETSGAEEDCLANAVYFEARGESLEGQLAVAEVVMNRAASGRYPATLCGVVRQPSQFSFVRRGMIPRADRGSDAWRRAVAVARIAQAGRDAGCCPRTCSGITPITSRRAGAAGSPAPAGSARTSSTLILTRSGRITGAARNLLASRFVLRAGETVCRSPAGVRGVMLLRIAQIAPLAEAVPPKLYGGTERVIWWLTEALVDLGHDVTLYASGDSETSARLVPCAGTGLRLAGINDHTASLLAMLDRVLRDADALRRAPFPYRLPAFPDLPPPRRQVPDHAARAAGPARFPAGLPRPSARCGWSRSPTTSAGRSPTAQLRRHRPSRPAAGPDPRSSATGGDYLAFIGRISPEKRPDRAIEIARRAGMKLKIAAKVDHADRAYFEERIEPLLDDPLIEFIGEIGDAEKAAFLGGARALLFPIDWPEPFGLVMIEAMAAGTPVIAWRCGSTAEVIEHGRQRLPGRQRR